MKSELKEKEANAISVITLDDYEELLAELEAM